MPAQTQLTTLVSQVQYLFLLFKQDLKFPKEIEWVRSYALILFNLDWSTIEKNVPSSFDWIFSIRFDFRVQYIVVCGIIPLLLSSILLLQYSDAFGQASFFLAAFGTFAFVAGVFGGSDDVSAYLIIAGVVLLAGAVITFLLSSSGALIRSIVQLVLRFFNKGQKKGGGLSREIEMMEKKAEQEENGGEVISITNYKKILKKKGLDLLRFGGSAVILFISAIMLTGLVRVSSITGYYNSVESAVFDSPFTWLFYVISAVLFLQAIIHFIAFVILIIPKGERLLSAVKRFVQATTLKFSFLFLTLVFTPIIATLVTSLHCDTFTCPAGTFPRERYLSDYKRHLPENNTMMSPFYDRYLDLTTSEKNLVDQYIFTPVGQLNSPIHWEYDTTICVPCDFPLNATRDKMCGYDASLTTYTPVEQFKVCPYQNVSVLQTDHTVSCGTMQSFYMWGSGVLMVLWGVGVPLLILLLILIAIRYSDNIPVDRIKDMEKPEEAVSAFDKMNDVVEEFQEGYWDTLLLKRFWPQKLHDVMESEYNPFYFPILKLMDGVAWVLDRISDVEKHLWTKKRTNRKKSFSGAFAILVRVFRRILKDSLHRGAAKLWFLRVGLLKNNLQTLYNSFEYRTRFFYLWDMVLKIFLTVVSAGLINYPTISVSVLTFTHLIIVCTWLFIQPYLNFFEDALSFVLALCTLINHIFALVTVFVELPWWAYFFLLFNLVTPILSIISLFLFFCIRNAKNSIKKSDYRYKELKEEVEEADKNITNVSIRIMNSFFFSVAVITVIILGFCLVGLSRDQPNVIPAASKGLYTVSSCDTRKKLEFAGYSSWSEFTGACCCQEDPFFKNKVYDPSTSNYQKVEVWHCDNGKRKLRVREAEIDGEIKSGLKFRDFCSRQFEGGMSLVTDDCSTQKEDFYYYVQDSSDPKNIQYENKYLW